MVAKKIKLVTIFDMLVYEFHHFKYGVFNIKKQQHLFSKW